MGKRNLTAKKSKGKDEKKISFFSENICRRRKGLGLTQAEFAQRAGLKQSQVSELENGRFVEYPERVVSLARALETTPDYLFGFREEP